MKSAIFLVLCVVATTCAEITLPPIPTELPIDLTTILPEPLDFLTSIGDLISEALDEVGLGVLSAAVQIIIGMIQTAIVLLESIFEKLPAFPEFPELPIPS